MIRGKGESFQKDIEESAVPETAQSALEMLRKTIRPLVPPGTTETISYGTPAFRYKGILVIYGALSDHCSLFSWMPRHSSSSPRK
jgi:uncharacterized protein YdhG (YjbR/CyaY superfamily)